MIRNVRLTVRDWDGTLRHERYLKHADPALQMDVPGDGFEAGRTGYQGCLELTFQAIWSTLQVQERDLLELDTLDELGVWHREYAGVVVKSGNSQLTRRHSNFKATGLKKRATEVRLVADVEEGDAGAQLRAALQAVIASSQLGNAIVYDPAAIPDTGVLLGKFPARGRKLSDLCDYLAGQCGRVWDVDADRKLFLKPRSTTAITLTEGTDVRPTYEDTDSEALVTQVLLNIGTWNDGTLIQYPVISPDWASFGIATTDVTVDPSTISGWLTGPLALPAVVNTNPLTSDMLPILVDFNNPFDDGTYTSLSVSPTTPATPFSLTFTLATPAWRVDAAAVWFAAAGDVGIEITRPGESATLIPPAAAVGAGAPRILQQFLEARETPFPIGTTFRVLGGLSTSFNLSELRPEAPNTAILEPLAQFHFVTPRRDPATVQVVGRVTPQPMLSLMRADGSTYETTTESVTLHLKLNALGVSVIQAGQREPAEARAARWLGKVALNDASMDATRFGAGQ